MIKYNFIKVIIFISILVLFFAQSVYDPSVHARMKKIQDEDLADIDATALDIDMNISVRSVVSSDTYWRNNTTTTPDIINIASMEIGNGTLGSAVAINTVMSWDIGHNGTDTWLLGGNVVFPTSTSGGMGIFANVVTFVNNNATTLPIGNATIKGLYFGQRVTAPVPNLNPTQGTHFQNVPWVIISNHNVATDRQGIKAYSELCTYVNEIALNWRAGGGTTNVVVQGLYVYGLMNDTAGNTTSSSWTERQGMLKLGGNFPTYNAGGSATGTSGNLYALLDIGSSGSVVNGTRIRLDTPFAGSIRIRDVNFGTGKWGPFALDDMVFYRNTMTIRQL